MQRDKTTIKPRFYFFHQLPKVVFGFLVPSIVLIAILMYRLEDDFFSPVMYLYYHTLAYMSDMQNTMPPRFWVGVLCTINILFYLIIIWVLLLFLKKLFYSRVTFDLNDTGITYTINFVIFSQKHVRYTDIKEINLNQGPLQRLFKLATIKITTHATTADAGIEIYNIKPYHEVYDFLMTKTNK